MFRPKRNKLDGEYPIVKVSCDQNIANAYATLYFDSVCFLSCNLVSSNTNGLIFNIAV